MGRVVTDAELVDLVAADRAAGRSIAFANGCFDVLHVGHARYLAGAKAEGDPKDLPAPPAYAEGWMIRIRLANPAEVDELLDAPAYDALIAAG